MNCNYQVENDSSSLYLNGALVASSNVSFNVINCQSINLNISYNQICCNNKRLLNINFNTTNCGISALNNATLNVRILPLGCCVNNLYQSFIISNLQPGCSDLTTITIPNFRGYLVDAQIIVNNAVIAEEKIII